MSVFEPIPVEWNGKQLVIPANNVLPLIANIESKITFMELAAAMNNRVKLPIATLAQVYGMVLRHAGHMVSDDDVYAGMFRGERKADVEAGLQTLLVMMTPPGAIEAALKRAEAMEAEASEVAAPVVKKPKGSSNRASRRSAAAKTRRSARVSSGS